MTFQYFYGLYLSNNIFYKNFNKFSSHTWEHDIDMGDGLDYAYVWSQGKSLEEACPEHLSEGFSQISKKISSFFKSFNAVGLKVSKSNVEHVFPKKVLSTYLTYLNEISDYVFENYEKPENYEFMCELHKFCKTIESQPLKVNLKNIPSPPEKLLRCSKYVKYDPYKCVTGRLTTVPGSFPIHTLKKEYRAVVEPRNDCFLELDFNAFEVRVLLSILEMEQPAVDIHEWNAKNVFKEDLTREEIKKRTFSWLYNDFSLDKELNIVYPKKVAKLKHFNNPFVETIFNRKIKAKEENALNYIIQSTASDLFLKQVIKIKKLLQDRASKVSFTIHDSVIIDFSLKDKEMVKEIVKVFSETQLGKYKVNTSVGKNFGSMKAVTF